MPASTTTTADDDEGSSVLGTTIAVATVVLDSTSVGLLADEEHELPRDSGENDEIEFDCSSNFSMADGGGIAWETADGIFCSSGGGGGGVEAESNEIFSSGFTLVHFISLGSIGSHEIGRLYSTVSEEICVGRSASSALTGSSFSASVRLLLATDSSFSSPTGTSVDDSVFSAVAGTGAATTSVSLGRTEAEGELLSTISIDTAAGMGSGEERVSAGGELGDSLLD